MNRFVFRNLPQYTHNRFSIERFESEFRTTGCQWFDNSKDVKYDKIRNSSRNQRIEVMRSIKSFHMDSNLPTNVVANKTETGGFRVSFHRSSQGILSVTGHRVRFIQNDNFVGRARIASDKKKYNHNMNKNTVGGDHNSNNSIRRIVST